MKFWKVLQLGGVALVALSAVLVGGGSAIAAQTEAQSAQARGHDEWVEEILLQLSELRKSQGELVKRLESLEANVSSLKANGVAVGKGKAEPLNLTDASVPVLGDSRAEIAIVEFSDFECPFCRKHEQTTLPGLAQSYVNAGKIRYYFVDFPLGFHASAMSAAIAAACAHQQGAFWKMHDRLFENQQKLGDALYTDLAGELSLDKNKFAACRADPKTRQQIAAHIAVGERVGVDGTPAFLVGRLKNGVLTDAKAVSGARPLEYFESVLHEYLPGS